MTPRIRPPDRWRGPHRWFGLAAALLLSIAGFSGSLLEMLQRPEPPTWVSAQTDRQPTRQSLDRLFAAVQAAHPRRYGPWLLELPQRDSPDLVAWYLQPEETEDRGHVPLLVSVDTGSARIVSTRFWDAGGIGWIMQLHRRLGLEGPGASIATGLLTLALAGSGLWLWWSGDRRLAAPPVAGAGWSDWSRYGHRLLGLFASPVLLTSALTGIALNLPERWTAPTETDFHPGGALRSTAEPTTRPLGIEEAVAMARGLFPHASLRRVGLPAGEIGVYRVDLCQRLETDCRHPATAVWVDRYSGQIRGVDNPATWPRLRRLAHDLGTYHSGTAFGSAGRWYWCLAGLAPLLLFTSGCGAWAIRRGWIEDAPVDWRALVHRILAWIRLDAARLSGLVGTARRIAIAARNLLAALRHKHFE